MRLTNNIIHKAHKSTLEQLKAQYRVHRLLDQGQVIGHIIQRPSTRPHPFEAIAYKQGIPSTSHHATLKQAQRAIRGQ